MTIAPFQETNQSLILMAVDALASAPHLTEAQKKTRANAVVTAIMAFRPSEPVQTMLAIQGVGHHFTLLDTFKEIAIRPVADTMSLRLRTITTAQTKTTLALIKEIRIVREDMRADAETASASPVVGSTEIMHAGSPPPADPSPVHAAAIEETSTAPEDVNAPATPTAEKAAPPCLNRAQRRALRHLAATIAPNTLSRDRGAGRRPASARH